jgi:hypothetical protein
MRSVRSHHVSLCVVAIIAAVACSGDDDSSASVSTPPAALEIGPGASDRPPAAANGDPAPDREPAWVDDVPTPTETALDGAKARAFASAANSGLAAPPRRDRERTTTSATDASSVPIGDYAGTMTLEIAYYNYCITRDGNLAYAGSGAYELDSDVFINEPAEHDGVRERSPFNLIVASELGVEGSLLVMSGQVVTDTVDGRSAVIDYWDIDEVDGEIEGTLTDRWPGLAYNLITTSQPIVPCVEGLDAALPDQIAQGATLTGTISEDTIALELFGQSLDREVRFHAVIEAQLPD